MFDTTGYFSANLEQICIKYMATHVTPVTAYDRIITYPWHNIKGRGPRDYITDE